MSSDLRDLRRRLEWGQSARTLAEENLAAVESDDGEMPPVVCRTESEIDAADALEWADLAAALTATSLAPERIEALAGLRDASWEGVPGGRRGIFDLFSGTPPSAVLAIAVAHLNDREERVTGDEAADTYLNAVRRSLRELPENEQRALLTAVSSRPSRAFLHRFPEGEVLDAAAAVDARRAAGDHLPLAGATLAVKDVFALGPTTAASRILAGYRAPADYVAGAVANLVRAGAVVVGKSNLDEFALGSSNESTAFWPAPRNPHDRARVPGGSSGGSAVAVGTGQVTAGLGSDTAGSIRVPASYCGCVGLKPTYGLVSRAGLFALSSSLDCVGPLARTVYDAAVLLGCLVGEEPDGLDQTQRRPPGERSTGAVRPEERYTEALADETALAASLRGLTVGVPVEYFLDFDLDERREAQALVEASRRAGRLDLEELARRREESHLTGTAIGAFFDWLEAEDRGKVDGESVEELWREFRGSAAFRRSGSVPLDKLRRCPSYWERFGELAGWLERDCGVELRLVSLPHTSLSIPAYFVVSRYELASNLHRYDGLKYGRPGDEEIHGSYHQEAARRRLEGFGTQPKQRILLGIHALQKENHEHLRLRAQRARRRIREDFLEVFAGGVDLLLAPTVNTVAPHFGGFSDTVAQQQMDQFSVPANHAGVPAVSVPFYRTPDESMTPVFPDLVRPLPQSAQVIAPDFGEATMFRLAAAVERWQRRYGGGEP